MPIDHMCKQTNSTLNCDGNGILTRVLVVFICKNTWLSHVVLIRRKINKMNNILNNKHFKYGLPFIITVVGGSYGLKFYSQLRYDIQNERHIMSKTKELQKIIGPTKPKTIEEEYEEYKKTVNIDNWKNIRGPRPWETDNQEYKELIEKRAAESKNQWVFK